MEAKDNKIKEIDYKLENIKFLEKVDYEEEFGDQPKTTIDTKGATTISKQQSKKDQRLYAIKQTEFPANTDLSEGEMRTLRKVRLIRHTNVIKYHACYKWQEGEKNILVIKMDYCEVDLEGILEKKIEKNDKPTDGQIFWMIKQGISMLSYLKESLLLSVHGISSKDIQSSTEDVWKFSNFDNCFDHTGETGLINMTGREVNPYMAPELVKICTSDSKEGKIDPVKADIFSLGMVLIQFSGPLKKEEIEGLNSDTTEETQQKLTNLIKSAKVGGSRKFLGNIFNEMTMANPADRISLSELKKRLADSKICIDTSKTKK